VHKTGSTAIQKHFWHYADQYRQAGVLYPIAGRPKQRELRLGHHEIGQFLLGNSPSLPEVLTNLEREARSSTARIVLVSSEVLDRLNSEQVVRFATVFPKNTRVIFYYRRQSEVLQGLYGTHSVHFGYRGSIHRLAQRVEERLDYLALAKRWASVVGRENIVARPYLRSSFLGGDVVSDFLSTLALPVVERNPGEQIDYNVSLPWYAVMIIRRMWSLELPRDHIRAAVPAIRAICRGEDNSRQFMSPSEAAAFDRKFELSNRAFCDEFCAGQNPIEPPEAVSDVEWDASQYQSRAALERMLLQLTKYVAAQEARGIPPIDHSATMQAKTPTTAAKTAFSSTFSRYCQFLSRRN